MPVSHKSLYGEFMDRVLVRPGRRCWMWSGWLQQAGYGALCYRGETHIAHRLSYELHVGPIADDMTIDHLCRHRGCVNPAHLEVVTRGENTRRGLVLRPPKTHCSHGHEYTTENTRIDINGAKTCRQCIRLWNTGYYLAKKLGLRTA